MFAFLRAFEALLACRIVPSPPKDCNCVQTMAMFERHALAGAFDRWVGRKTDSRYDVTGGR